jgi:hypothetical protein
MVLLDGVCGSSSCGDAVGLLISVSPFVAFHKEQQSQIQRAEFFIPPSAQGNKKRGPQFNFFQPQNNAYPIRQAYQ